MAHYTYTLTEFDGQSLTGGNLTCRFRRGRGPLTTRPIRPVEVRVPLRGDQDVRGQPTATTWALWVVLGNTDETDLDALFEIFDEERGLQFLKVTDGAASPVTWRVKARVLSIRRGSSDKYFEVVLRVPDPVWEEDTETDATEADTASTAKTWTQTNNGSRKVRGIYTLSPKGVRTEADLATLMSLRGFIVQRAPEYWNNEPVHLFDDGGADDTIDHAALVNDTAVASTTLSTTISIGQSMPFTITVASAASFDPSGFIVIEHGTGDIEQFRYSAKTATTLTLEERAIGGTSAAAHASADALAQSRSLFNGDDIRVYVNGVEVKRWLDGTNTTALKCWINATMPPVLRLTLLDDLTAGAPADGGDLEFVEGVASLPERGQVAIENEVITYQGRDLAARKITTIERGAHGTTAASHTASSVTVYRCDILFVVTTGFADATAVTAPLRLRPCIQLKASTNIRWYWGDIADDALTSFWDQDEPDRSAQWRPSTEQDPSDKAKALRMLESDDFVSWETDEPAAGKPLVSRLTVDLPQGIKAASNAINYDIQKRKDRRLRILGRDAAGLEVELVDAQDVAEALQADQKVTPDAVLHQLIYNGVRAYTTLQNTNETATHTLNQLKSLFYRMILDQDTSIKAIQLKLKKQGGGDDFTFTIGIFDDSGATPNAGLKITNLDQTSGSGFTAANLTTGYVTYEFTAVAGAVTLVAGTYWIEVEVTARTSGALLLPAGLPQTKNVNHYNTAAAAFSTSVTTWQLVHEGAGPVQPEAVDQDHAANDAALGDTDVLLNNASGDEMTPYVDRDGDFSIGQYHIIGQLKNNTTGDFIDIDFWAESGGDLVIDVEKRTVVYTKGNHVVSVPGAITPSNLEDWLPLVSGGNSMQYLEPVANLDIRHQHRGRKL